MKKRRFIEVVVVFSLFCLISPVCGAQAPYGGTPWAIPGTIQCEDYDTGGEGVAYHDLTTANEGGAYRLTEGVDIGTCGEGGYALGYATAPDEWVEYTVNVASTGTYSVSVRAATVAAGGSIHIEMDGVNVTGSIAIPNTNGWQTYTTVTVYGVSLTAGQHIMRMVMDTNCNLGGYSYVANFNYITFTLTVPGAADDNLTINTGTVLNTITYPWLGVHYVAFWDSIQGSTASRNAMMNAGIEMIRFPGGAPADWIDWARPYAGGWSSTSTMDLWNYAQGVGSGVKLMLDTNPTANIMGDGLPNDSSGTHAAAWVTYCKNNNIAAPYWEVGNEEDITLTSDYQWAAYQWYLDKFGKQAAAMKAADPSIKVVGNVGTNAWYWWGIHSLDMFMQTHGNKTGTGLVDAVSIHWYPAPAWPGWGNVISNAQGWQVNYDYIRSVIVNRDTRNLPLFISETNGAVGGNGGDMSKTMACAIVNSDMLGAMAESGVQSVQLFGCIHAVDNNWGFLAGSGESQPAETPTCAYYTLPVWSKVGRTIVSVTGETDPATTLSAYGMKSANGHVQALIHNKTAAARSVQVAFDSGYNPTGQAVSIYEIRPTTAGDVWNFRCYYNNVNWPSPTTTNPLPSPIMSACSGATYTRTVPAYSVTMLDFGGTPIAGPPVASDDSYSTWKNVALNISAPGVLANDVDPEGETLTAVKVSEPSHGSVTLNSDGSFLYTPTTGYVGADSFTYKAYDNSEGYSNVVTVSITVKTIPPTVSITSPANGTTFTEPTSFTINATASDSDGTVTKVDFYQGATLLGTDTTSPYSYAWTNVVAGNYSLTAKATDNDGAVTTSSAINITGHGTNVTPVAGTWYKLIWRGTSNNRCMSVSGGSTADGAQIILWPYGGGLDQQWQLVDKGGGYRQFINRNSSKSVGIADACTADGAYVKQQTAGSGLDQQWTLTATDSGYYKITNRNSGKDLCIYGGWDGDGAYLCQWTAAGQWGFQIPPGPGGINPPTVSITSPLNGDMFFSGDDIVIEANASDTDGFVTKVEFFQGSTKLGEDTSAPYSYTWNDVPAGRYSLTARATDNNDGISNSLAVSIGVTSGEATGFILREWWTGLGSGNPVSDLTSDINYPNNPNGRALIASLEGPTDWADNYGTRIRGYLYPPADGNYTFWIASDDASELWLSTDEQPGNASKIAYVSSWTNSREWNKETNQQSAQRSLLAGNKYYIEALQKEGSGGDNIAVAWLGPGITQQVIDGVYLSPYLYNFEDYAIFAPQWLKTNCSRSNAWCSGADRDRDGNVQIDDLAAFADGWLAGN